MKNFKIIFLFIALFAMGTVLTSCGDGAAKSEKANTAQQGKEYTSAYICPMHCDGSGSDAAGKCPTCGMDYVANDKKKKEAEHSHDHNDHDGHNH